MDTYAGGLEANVEGNLEEIEEWLSEQEPGCFTQTLFYIKDDHPIEHCGMCIMSPHANDMLFVELRRTALIHMRAMNRPIYIDGKEI